MKYWFFDGNDVIGPFAPRELLANKSFSAVSLVCPENFSDQSDHWQPAALFAELATLLRPTDLETDEDTLTFEEEMDTLLKERSPLAFEETPTDGPGLEIPKKPSKPGPIEDYFNHIKKEDLGDILGIPDPNDNSDLDLAQALEKQLAKTASTRREQAETAPEPQPEPALEQTHHVATATEVFATQAPVQSATMPTVPCATMPVLAAQTPAGQLRPLAQAPVIAEAAPAVSTEGLQPLAAREEIPAQDFAGQPETAPQEPSQIIPDPALLRAEKVEVNSVRARLKQTQEMKDFLHETQNAHLNKKYNMQRKIGVILLAALAILGALVWTLQASHHKRWGSTASADQPAASAPVAQELLAEPARAITQPLNREQQALAIVQNYPLSNQRGTLASYLNQIYQTQLAQGYTATWQAEPLHQNTYIVKYRLTKTRKEPIIYVFQADVAANKLTGALNNISLDLVGKI